MRFFHHIPPPLVGLITTFLLLPPISANPRPAASVQAGFDFNELFARWDCSGELCGWNDQLCCQSGQACYTDANDQAQCTAGGGGGSHGASSYVPAPSAPGGGGGYWKYYTTVYTVTDREVVTSIYSTYMGGASAHPSGSAAQCNYAINESPCGDICCAGNQYCAKLGHCAAAGGHETTVDKTAGPGATAGAPLRPTSSGVTVATVTASPTTTVPFQTPVATGANVTMTESSSSGGGGGLSGGAIAGIVIGVLIGLLILGLICFYCCIKGLLDGCLALIGLGGKKRRKVTEVDEYERRSSHHGGGGGGGRTWYGAAKPSRVDRRNNNKKDSHNGGGILGLGAGLAGLWALLGLKRQRKDRRRNDEKYSDYGSYSSDYYTSASSASSDDRRTRYTHGRSASRSRR